MNRHFPIEGEGASPIKPFLFVRELKGIKVTKVINVKEIYSGASPLH